MKDIFHTIYKYLNKPRIIRLILPAFFFVVLQSTLQAQPSEINYPGTIIATGFRQNIPLSNDGPFPIGFDFTFFGNTYTEFWVTANGQIMFSDPDTIYNFSVTIPDPAAPNNFIAPFWDNLSIVDGGKILYGTIGTSSPRMCVIQFKNMGFDPTPTPLGTFTVILYETSNEIKIQYRLIVDPYSAKSHGENAAIGLENSDGTAGAQFAYHNGDAVHTEDAILFTPSGPSTYTVDPNALYEGVYLTTNTTLPDPGIAGLIAPAIDAVIGTDQVFEWSAADNAASYILVIDTNSDLSTADYYFPGSDLNYPVTGLILDKTYYWGVFATNATATTWCQIKRFTTSSAPPVTPVPQTIWTEQGRDTVIRLRYTGGDASYKAAIIASLPPQGQLYQYSSGSRGSLISVYPTTVTDANMNVIYAATGGTGKNVGNFNFRINDASGNSPVATITVNVSPPGVPNVLHFAKDLGVEIRFDRTMADPSGKENQFEVLADGNPVTITSAALKEGDPQSIVLTLSPALLGTEAVILSYTQGDVTSEAGGYLFSFTDQAVTLKAQTITFTQSLDKKFSDSPFTLVSSASSGLGMTYSSSNQAVATISANKATFLSIGSSNITARQAGNTEYAPANYTRTLTVAKGDQTITFNPLPTKTVGDVDFSPGATASSGLAVTYISYNTAVATIVNSKIHIVSAGTAVITAYQSGNVNYNAASPVSQTLTVQGSQQGKTLNLTSVLLEGLYNGSGTMRQAWNESGPQWPAGVADHITVELHSGTNYATVVYTASDVPLSTTGTCSVTIPDTYNGSYYITIRHRNSIETTTATAVSFSASVINQSFGTRANVYGSNLGISGDGHYLIYAGDVNQDGFIDTSDYIGIDNDSYNYVSGYLATDVDGNGTIDTSDYICIDNNNYNYIGTIHP